MADQAQEQAIDKANLYLSEARWRRDDQAERHEALNRRLNTLFALNFAVLAVLGASLRFGELVLPGFLEYLIYSTIFVLVFNIGLLLWAYRVGRGSRRPDLDALRTVATGVHPYEVVILWTVREILMAMDANEERIFTKGQWVTRAMITSVLAVLMVAAAASLALGFAEK